MKTRSDFYNNTFSLRLFPGQFITSLLIAVLLATVAGTQAATVFTSMHSFGVYTNGANPYGPLVKGNDGNFYGTTYYGGTNGGNGTVFKITTNGVFTLLHTFNGMDGKYPYGGLALGTDGNFYGTTYYGGANGSGTIFKISASGVFTNLYSFAYTYTGAYPRAGLVLGNDGIFYGTTYYGGTNGYGTVFKFTTNGVLTSLHSFTGTNDGRYPYSELVQGSDSYLYGTTYNGGTNGGNGTIFKISTNGAFTSLYSFTGGNDGRYPAGGMTQGGDGFLYGTTYYGGSNTYYGTVFKISTGGAFTSLRSFSYSTGGYPYGTLILLGDGYLYGTTEGGGPSGGYGTVFKITTNGTFTSLYSFTGGNDGEYPYSGLALGNDGKLYGATYGNSPYSGGTVFRITTNGVFSGLYSFIGDNRGVYPYARLLQGITDANLYGTTFGGGAYGDNGTVFRITTNAMLTNIYSFTYGNDGADPYGGLVLGKDGYFYGTAEYGGAHGYGVVYKINASGVLTPLYSFSGYDDGAYPYSDLVQGEDGNFYGITYAGGMNDYGTIFKVSPSGVFTSLYSFTGGDDGQYPYAGLVQGNDGFFYGTTYQGGTNDYGTVFKIGPNGAFTGLYSFTGGYDGGNPYARLTLGNDGYLYGTTYYYGTNGNGTVFKISPVGAFTSLFSFNYDDGAYPYGALYLASDGNFYGTTSSGGTNGGYGTVFKITTNGVLTSLYSFSGGRDGDNPYAGLLQGYDGKFYGTTVNGGVGGRGTVFSLSVGLTGIPIVQFTASTTGGMPPLTVHFKSANVDVLGNPIVSWKWNFGDGATSTLQNPSHTYVTVGTFKPTLTATNNQGNRVAGLGPQITTSPVDLVQNGGFETGDFTSWSTSGNFVFSYVTMDPTFVHSGNYGAELGPNGSLGYLSQTLTTVPGQSYLLSLWLNSPTESTPNEFTVNWGGNNIFDKTNIPAIGWTNLLFNVVATGASTDLRFGFRNDLNYLGLDDVSVLPGSGDPVILTMDGYFGFRTNRFGFNIAGTNGLVVVVEASTNLGFPLWIPVFTNTLSGGTYYFVDPKWTNFPRRFYRVKSP